MKVKKYNLEDVYSDISLWFNEHNFPQMPMSLLSDEILICQNQMGEALYAISVYLTNSGVCWVGFPISNPFISKEKKENGLAFLLQGVEEYARQLGYEHIFTTSPIKHVQDIFLSAGYQLGDENVNHYIKNI